MSIKTAICISGLPKFWDCSLQSIKKWFPDADIFIFTWLIGNDEISNKTVCNLPCYANNNLENNFDKICSEFKPKNLKIQNFRDQFNIFVEMHKQHLPFYTSTHGATRYLDETMLRSISPFSMFYGIEEVFKLKQEYENVHNFKYDLVIRMRFDSYVHSFLTDFEFLNNEENTIHVPAGRDHGGLNDQFSFGKSREMDLASKCYSHFSLLIQENKTYAPEPAWKYYIEQYLKFNVVRDDINISINNGN
jgi:hypothetical protein